MRTEADFRGRPKRHWLKYLCVMIGGLSLLVMLAIIGMNYAGRYSLRRAADEARQLGQPVTCEEIVAARQSWPADQDAGLHFMRIRDRIRALDKDPELKPLPVVGEGDLPPIGHLWNAEQMAAVQAQLARIALDLEQINKLKDFPGGSLPFVPPQTFEEVIEKTPLLELRVSSRLKHLDLLQRLMAGNLTKAEQDLLVLRRHGELVRDHPFLISSLIGAALDATAVSALERALSLGVFTPDALKGLEADLPDPPQSLYWGLLGDRAIFGQSYDNALGQAAPWQLTGWLNLDRAAGFSAVTRLAQAARNSPKPLPLAREVIASVPKRYVLSNGLLPSIETAFELSSRNVAQIRSARVGLAVERHRLAEGRFPQDLSHLVPAYIPQIPDDPFTDTPLRYVLTQTGAVVYSIGEDGIDNHGNVDPIPRNKEGLDWGFRVLRPELRRLPPVSTQPTDAATQTH